MLRHLFKMIWNRKKQNVLLIVEMLVSFMVVFAVFTLLVYSFKNYRQPLGFEYENVWVINTNDGKTLSADSLWLRRQALNNQLKSLPEVISVSWTGNNLPFAMSTRNWALTHKNVQVQAVNRYISDDGMPDVMNFKLAEGRWFNEADDASKDDPVVITSVLKEKLFGSGSAIDEVIADGFEQKQKMRVIGVIDDIKDRGDYLAAEPGIFERVDTSSLGYTSNILVKVVPGAGAAFESRLFKMVASFMNNANIEIEQMTEKREHKNNLSLIPMIILLIVAGFLIINVALGLFGVLWYNINKRRSEIGLRRAIGATANSVSGQLVGEALVISSIALIVGSFFALQFPLLKLFDLPSMVYVIAWLLAIAFIYLLVFVCAVYPGKQAAEILPAIALREE